MDGQPAPLAARIGTRPRRDTARSIAALLILVAMLELLRTAWISDDALITVRCILNALHGYGPNFNIDERVQAFTHPLWFLLVLPTTAIVGVPWLAMLLLSAVATAGAIWLLYARIGGYRWMALAAACLLLFSKPYVDYMTSGLESPLSNLLLFAVMASGFRRLATPRCGGITTFLTYSGLLYLNRAYLALLVTPFVLVTIYTTYHTGRAFAQSLAIAAIPVLAWTAFSLVYYGYLVPNTAFGKLAQGIPEADRLRQGALYLIDSIGHDVLTVPAIVAGVAIGLRRGAACAALAAGILLYLMYIVAIGGDQMSGRFLVAPFAVAVAIMAHGTATSAAALAPMAVLMLLGMLGLPNTLLSDTDMGPARIRVSGIADERAIFFHHYGLPRVTREMLRPLPWAKHVRVPSRVEIIKCGGLGTFGLVYGPQVHLADQCALADPLMSHLPAKPDPTWRIGHIERALPDGYAASIMANANLITDPKTAALYATIRTITRGPLFTRARFAAIARMNFGYNAEEAK